MTPAPELQQSAAVTGPALSPQQFKQALWADDGASVYAVVIGDRVPDLQQRLQAAGIDDWDRLWTGELDAAQQQAAPVLLALQRGSAFADWLVDRAYSDLGPWGLLLLSAQPVLPLRQHGRDLCEARLPDGDEIRLDWMDPEVALALLPVAAPDQLRGCFAALQALVLPQPHGWVWLRLDGARLEQRNLALQVAA
jgi:hypothetical protein